MLKAISRIFADLVQILVNFLGIKPKCLALGKILTVL